jgi:hypothetical protein
MVVNLRSAAGNARQATTNQYQAADAGGMSAVRERVVPGGI